MKWKLLSVDQETDHPFLNAFTLHYEVTKDDGSVSPYSYYMASRNAKDKLKPCTHEYARPDGVIMALYQIDEQTKEISILMTRQYRPALGTYMTSFPAGLLDPGDKGIDEAAVREAKEEAGVEIADLELLAPSSPSSSGLSDEQNAFVLARIVSKTKKDLEEFEDISVRLYSLKEIRAMMKDPEHYKIPLPARLCLLYLLERFR